MNNCIDRIIKLFMPCFNGKYYVLKMKNLFEKFELFQLVSELGHGSMCSTGTSNPIMGGESGLDLIPHRLGRRTKHSL